MTALLPPPPPPRVRLDYLHGLRGLAALAVVLGHCAQLAQGDDGTPPLLLSLLRHASGLAVPTFIVLSGYCLALPAVATGALRLEGGLRGFLVRRGRRILPAYYGALVLSVVVGLGLLHTITAGDVLGLRPVVLGPLLLAHDALGATPYDVPLWSIAVEWHIYLLLPLLLWLGRRQRGGLPLAAALGAAAALLLIGPTQHAGLAGLSLHLYALFCAGALAAWIGHAPGALPWRVRVPWRTLVTLGGLSALGAFTLLGWAGFIAQYAACQVGWGGLVAVALVWMQVQPGHVGALLGRRSLVRLGQVSYSLYLLHWLPCSALATALAGYGPTAHQALGLRLVVLTALALPTSLGLALCSYRVLERPALCRQHRPRALPVAGAVAVA